ncbi:MAG: TrmH family RNA methyltransferase [Patescibacteria group bacterium]
MIAVLHNIRSIHNVGSIFRTADAVGIAKLFLCGITPAPIDDYGRQRSALLKVSLGAEQSVYWESASSTLDVLMDLRTQGYILCALEQAPSSISLYSYPFAVDILDRLAIIVGNEIDGLPQDVMQLADAIVHIPMYGNKESLNVSVAFGICVYSILERTKK